MAASPRTKERSFIQRPTAQQRRNTLTATQGLRQSSRNRNARRYRSKARLMAVHSRFKASPATAGSPLSACQAMGKGGWGEPAAQEKANHGSSLTSTKN